MNSKHTIAAVSVALVGLLTFASTASAGDLSVAKTRCDAAINERQVELDKLTNQSNAAKNLGAEHRSTIGSIISSSKSGLSDLNTKIDGDTDAATLKADCETIYSGFRVFALRAPQVHLAIVGDRAVALTVRGNTVAAKLDAAIQKAAANGKDVNDANVKLADMQAKLADVTSLLNGAVDNELTFTPGQWNANHDVLKSSNTSIRSAHQDLKTAFADAKAIVADLKA